MIRGQDYTQQLAEYIKKNISKGYTPESLRWALVSQGHSRVQVDKAVKLATEQMAATAPKMVEEPMTSPQIQEMAEPEKKKGFWERLFS